MVMSANYLQFVFKSLQSRSWLANNHITSKYVLCVISMLYVNHSLTDNLLPDTSVSCEFCIFKILWPFLKTEEINRNYNPPYPEL